MISTIIVIEDPSLHFGCVKGVDVFNGLDVTMIVYDNPKKFFTTIVPLKGDVFICAWAYHSVFIPLCKIDMSKWLLRRVHPELPLDVLLYYFNPIIHVNYYRSISCFV